MTNTVTKIGKCIGLVRFVVRILDRKTVVLIKWKFPTNVDESLVELNLANHVPNMKSVFP